MGNQKKELDYFVEQGSLLVPDEKFSTIMFETVAYRSMSEAAQERLRMFVSFLTLRIAEIMIKESVESLIELFEQMRREIEERNLDSQSRGRPETCNVYPIKLSQ